MVSHVRPCRAPRSTRLYSKPRAFEAGSRRVLASLWAVPDQATAVLMEHFYTGVLKEGLAPAEALRTAQQKLRSNRRYRDPYYWGAFVLQGAW